MEESINECQKRLAEALISSGNAGQVDEMVRISLEILWNEAQQDYAKNNPPKFITLDA